MLLFADATKMSLSIIVLHGRSTCSGSIYPYFSKLQVAVGLMEHWTGTFVCNTCWCFTTLSLNQMRNTRGGDSSCGRTQVVVKSLSSGCGDMIEQCSTPQGVRDICLTLTFLSYTQATVRVAPDRSDAPRFKGYTARTSEFFVRYCSWCNPMNCTIHWVSHGQY